MAVAIHVKPEVQGFGSHRQLSLPECSWITQKDMPCPTCGMTTAYSLTVRGRLIRALTTQPAGCLLALAHLALAFLLAIVAISGKYPQNFAIWANYHALRLLLIAVIIVLAGWGWTILRFKEMI
ncbi:MAG: DUF2752 domain-containing protein [Sedimentisphaerales bacterium]|nr:DUF2752 domain-containing protein [Sedimentisphaerales bacterium]